MATVGLNLRIDVSKIDKERIYKGKKGQYLDVTTFVNLDEKDQYGNNGFISQSVTKEERDGGLKTPILGNVQMFYPASSTNESKPTTELEDAPF